MSKNYSEYGISALTRKKDISILKKCIKIGSNKQMMIQVRDTYLQLQACLQCSTVQVAMHEYMKMT